MNRISRSLMALALALAICLGIAVPALAANESNTAGVTFSLELSDDSLYVSEDAQTVTLSIKASQALNMVDLVYDLAVPEGFTVGEPAAPGGAGSPAWNPDTLHMSWMNVTDVKTDTLGTVEITVPAGTPAGEYEFQVSGIELIDNAETLEEMTATAAVTLTVEEAPPATEPSNPTTPTEPTTPSEPTNEPYTADISKASEDVVVNGDELTVMVNVNGNIGTFNSAMITIEYDPTYLTFEAGTLAKTPETGDIVPEFLNDAENGIITILDYGKANATGTGIYGLTFKAIDGGNATVELTYAGFSTAELAQTHDLTEATGLNALDIDVHHNVTVDGVDGGSIAPSEDGEDYIVTVPDKNYEYEIEATIGGEPVPEDQIIDNGDGTYTIVGVTDDLVVTLTKGDPKSYAVNWTGDLGNIDPAYTDIVVATYGENIYIELPTKIDATQLEAGIEFMATITIAGSDFSHTLSSGENYTIDGEIITGEITIDVEEIEIPALGANEVTVLITGVPGVTIEGVEGNRVTVERGEKVTLKLTVEAGYLYSAKIGTFEILNNNVLTYELTVTANTTVNVTRTLDTTSLEVTEYLTLDGAKMYLLQIGTAEFDDKVYTFKEGEVTRNLFWSEKYGAYVTLVIASEAPVAEDLAPNFALVAGTATEVDYGMDVNKSTNKDMNDAQLVYDMYNAKYTDFTKVDLEKFLRADVNEIAGIDSADAAAIVTSIKGSLN